MKAEAPSEGALIQILTFSGAWEYIYDEFFAEDFLPSTNPCRSTALAILDSAQVFFSAVHLRFGQCDFLVHSKVQYLRSNGRAGVVEFVYQFYVCIHLSHSVTGSQFRVSALRQHVEKIIQDNGEYK